MPVSAWMIDALDPQPGQSLLELAAGTGDTGLLAAELIAPTGELISSDFAPEMLAAAQRRAEELGIAQRALQADRRRDEHRRRRPRSIDGVLCRWGYMLMADPGNALRETRRVLRPGGRVALAAWAGPEDNPWSVAAGRELAERGLAEPPDPARPASSPGRREGVIAEQLEDAGFTDHHVEPLDFTIDFALAPTTGGTRSPTSRPAGVGRRRRPRRRVAEPRTPARRRLARVRAAGRGRVHRRPTASLASRARREAGRRARLVASRASMFYDDDADLTLLDGKTVAIIGYGSQGHAHALNLKDSGVDVVVGLRPDSASVAKAQEAGLEVADVTEAASRGDIVMVLLPDEKHGEVYREQIADGIAPGNLLLFGHGFSIHYGEVEPPADVDVALVAPKGPGHLVRRQYTEGSGVPGLIAVQQDATVTRRRSRSRTPRASAAPAAA